MDCGPPGSSVHGTSQARVLEQAAISFRDLPNPGIEPASPALQVDSLPLSEQGNPISPSGLCGLLLLTLSPDFELLGFPFYL